MEKLAVVFRKIINYESSVCGAVAPRIKGKNVLSVGCGPGKIERMLQASLGVSIRGVEVTKYKNPLIQTKLYDGKSLPFKDNQFDTTLFIYVLHHADNAEALLKEAMRVTSGEIIILDHTYTNSVSKALLKVYDYTTNVPYRMPIPFNYLTLRGWRKLFSRLNARVTEANVLSPLNMLFRLQATRA